MVRPQRRMRFLRRRFRLPARSLPIIRRSGGRPGEHGTERSPCAIGDRCGVRRVEPDADGKTVLGHFLQVVAQREQRAFGPPRSEVPVPAGLVLVLQRLEILVGRDEERRAGADNARTRLALTVRPSQAGHVSVRPPLYALWIVPERRRLQHDHDPEAQPPFARTLRPPGHPGGVRPRLLEAQSELRPLVSRREIHPLAVQGPRSEPYLRSGGKASERAGAVGVGAHVHPQPRRQVHERGRMIHVPGIEVPPGVERLPSRFVPRAVVTVRHDSPPRGRRTVGASIRGSPPRCARVARRR